MWYENDDGTFGPKRAVAEIAATFVRLADLNSDGRIGLQSAIFDSTTVYNQWTVFPNSFDPVMAELTFEMSPSGDFDANGSLEAADLDLMTRVYGVDSSSLHWLDEMFDVNRDLVVDEQRRNTWIRKLKNTWFGDANLDGEFNSGDLVTVFQAGEYEDAVVNNSGWAEGDWNGDGDFTSGNLVAAFQEGGYEKGRRPALAAVPEPSGIGMMTIALTLAAVSSSRRRGRRF